jgi:hypothetical protein
VRNRRRYETDGFGCAPSNTPAQDELAGDCGLIRTTAEGSIEVELGGIVHWRRADLLASSLVVVVSITGELTELESFSGGRWLLAVEIAIATRRSVPHSLSYCGRRVRRQNSGFRVTFGRLSSSITVSSPSRPCSCFRTADRRLRSGVPRSRCRRSPIGW